MECGMEGSWVDLPNVHSNHFKAEYFWSKYLIPDVF